MVCLMVAGCNLLLCQANVTSVPCSCMECRSACATSLKFTFANSGFCCCLAVDAQGLQQLSPVWALELKVACFVAVHVSSPLRLSTRVVPHAWVCAES